MPWKKINLVCGRKTSDAALSIDEKLMDFIDFIRFSLFASHQIHRPSKICTNVGNQSAIFCPSLLRNALYSSHQSIFRTDVSDFLINCEICTTHVGRGGTETDLRSSNVEPWKRRMTSFFRPLIHHGCCCCHRMCQSKHFFRVGWVI